MPRPLAPEALIASLDAHLAKTARRRARRGLPAPQVLVTAPGFEYVSGDRTLPFHAASIGKLATTALVMQEVEAGRQELSTPVADLLPAAAIKGLFAQLGATVEQLLAHTSGVADYFEGPVTEGPHFLRLVLDEPGHRWEPGELLAFSRDRQRPVGRPGERFVYSDTGYVLLGRILEEATGRSFAELLRDRVFEPAGMEHSVLWLREPGPERIAPAWLGGVEVSGFTSLSCDWAGGSIVSTLDDLARFATALADGTLFARESFAAMTAPRHRLRSGIHYGLGAMQLRFEGFMPLLRGLPRAVGHLGILGTHCFTNPDHGTTIILNFHDTREMVPSVRTHIRIVRGLGLSEVKSPDPKTPR